MFVHGETRGESFELWVSNVGQPIPEGRVVALPEGVDGAALRESIKPDETAFMTCGNPGMIEDLKEPAHAIGVGTYLVEEFWKA